MNDLRVINEVYVGRQAIFNAKKEVVAYELLFRDGLLNYCSQEDSETATTDVIVNSLLNIGLNMITGKKKATIKFSHSMLKNDKLMALGPDKMAIEMIDSIEPTAEMISNCCHLKQRGYELIIGNFSDNPAWLPIIDIADIVKIDFKATSGVSHKALAERFAAKGIKLLTKKIESAEEFQQALSFGYTYFQGYFLEQPSIVLGKELHSNKIYRLKLMREISRPDFSVTRMEKIIEHDSALSYKLITYVNSSFFGLPNKIQSIRHALSLLGQEEIVKWISLLLLRDLGADKPQELLTVSIIRAKFAEKIALTSHRRSMASQVFLAGMLSLIDVLLDAPMKKIVELLSVEEEIANTLLGEKTELRRILDLVIFFEQAKWEEVRHLANYFDLTPMELNSMYWESVYWEAIIDDGFGVGGMNNR